MKTEFRSWEYVECAIMNNMKSIERREFDRIKYKYMKEYVTSMEW